MKKLIHRLRKRPEHVRRKILFVSMVASFAALIALWVVSFGVTVSSAKTKTSIKEDLRPFAMLKSSIVGKASNISGPFSGNSTADTTDGASSAGLVPAQPTTTDTSGNAATLNNTNDANGTSTDANNADTINNPATYNTYSPPQ